MCFGGGKKGSSQPVTPAPAAPTKFEYVNADTSNTQQRQAAINSSTGTGAAADPSSFGAELGSASAAAPSAMGAA